MDALERGWDVTLRLLVALWELSVVVVVAVVGESGAEAGRAMCAASVCGEGVLS